LSNKPVYEPYGRPFLFNKPVYEPYGRPLLFNKPVYNPHRSFIIQHIWMSNISNSYTGPSSLAVSLM
jgi:hypothetical protein